MAIKVDDSMMDAAGYASGGLVGQLANNTSMTAADVQRMRTAMERQRLDSVNHFGTSYAGITESEMRRESARMQQHYSSHSLFGSAGVLGQAQAPPIDPVVRMQAAKCTFEQERHTYVKDHICGHLPEGFESLQEKIGGMFHKIEEWREEGKYVCQLSFLIDKDAFLYYKVKRTVPIPDGQSTPDITDVRGILLLSGDEAAMLATV